MLCFFASACTVNPASVAAAEVCGLMETALTLSKHPPKILIGTAPVLLSPFIRKKTKRKKRKDFYRETGTDHLTKKAI
jgi:hypothetical protein